MRESTPHSKKRMSQDFDLNFMIYAQKKWRELSRNEKILLRAFFKRKRFIKFFRFWQFFLMEAITVNPFEKTGADMK